jgi:hypothetical protein
VDQRGGGVGEQGVGPSGEREVMAQIAVGLLGGHRGHGVAQPDELVQCGEDAEFHSPSQGGLADQEAGERAGGVHVVIGEHADRLELRVVEEVGFVDDQDGGAAAFGLLDGEGVDGLRDQGGVVGQGSLPEGGDDLVVMPRTPTVGLGR